MRIAAQDAPKPRRHQSAGQVILFSVSRQTFAIAAGAVREIRDTDSLAGAAVEMEQTRVPKVRHTVERAHRTYFVVNACLHFHLPVSALLGSRLARIARCCSRGPHRAHG